jgi:ketosteroid isomerase-like protein
MDVQELGQHSFALLREGLAGDSDTLGMFCDLFAADAELWLPPTPNTRSPYRGRDAIRQLLCGFVAPLYPDGLQLRLYQVLTGADRVLFQFEDRGRKHDGSDYQNSPCIALRFRDQQIAGFWEYWGGPGFFRGQLDGSGARGGIDADAQSTARQAMSQLIAGMGGSITAMDAFLALMADEVRLWFPPTANTRSPYIGRADARRLFRDFLMTMYPNGMAIEMFHETSGGTRTAFELQSRGVRSDGSVYVNSPCLCLDIKGGRIETLWEHWGGPGFHRPLAQS